MNQLLANNLPDRTAEQDSKDNTNKDPKQKKSPQDKEERKQRWHGDPQNNQK